MRPLVSPELPQPTPEQLKVASTLRMEYGIEDKLLICPIEGSGTGILRMDWCGQRRHLFIKPDGCRLVWESISVTGLNTGQMEAINGT